MLSFKKNTIIRVAGRQLPPAFQENWMMVKLIHNVIVFIESKCLGYF